MTERKKRPITRQRSIPNHIKPLIVTELAMFTAPSDVRDMVEKETGVRYNLSTIVYYDATSDSQLNDTLRELFWTTRKKFLEDTSRVAISHRSVRLRRYDRLARIIEEKMGEDIAKASPVVFDQLVSRLQSLDEQAAKDIGDAYTNKRTLLMGDPEEELCKALGITRDELHAALNAIAADSAANA